MSPRVFRILPLALFSVAGACTTAEGLNDVPGTIIVTTCDTRGDPVAGITIQAGGASAQSDESGKASLSLTPETYTVSITGGGPDRSLPPVELDGNETENLLDPMCIGPRQLPFRGAVAGDICNRHAGQWVQGAQVTIIAAGGERRDTRTDAEGHFLLQNIPEGEARMRIRSTDGRYYKRITLLVQAQRVNWVTTATRCTFLTPADDCTDVDDDGYGAGADCIDQDCDDTDARMFGECIDDLPAGDLAAETPTVLLLPRIQVSPAQLEFTGLLAGDDARTTQLTVANVGTGRLRFGGGALGAPAIEVESGPYASRVFVSFATAELLPGESIMVPVTVLPPSEPATYETALLIHSNDDLTPTVRVPINVVVGQPPGFVITPAVCERQVGINRPGICEFSLLNTADHDLTVQTIAMDVNSDEGFTVENIQGRLVGRGTAATVRVILTPSQARTYEGVVNVTSDEGQLVSATARITGTGDPTAVIDVLSVAGIPVQPGSVPDVRPLDDVVLTSSRSSAPPGRMLTTRRWELVSRPAESTVVLTAGSSLTSPTTAFTFNSSGVNRRGLDVAGTYIVGLTVTDSAGVPSSRATITLQAVPGVGLHVQLTWDHPTADVDLHLIRSTQTMMGTINTASDCYYANCRPSTGGPIWDPMSAAHTGGNPTLDVDDTNGIGPENITVEDARDGRYLVAVHIFSVNDSRPITATLKIFINGSLLGEFTESNLADRDLWTVGEVRVPGDAFNEIDALSTL